MMKRLMPFRIENLQFNNCIENNYNIFTFVCNLSCIIDELMHNASILLLLCCHYYTTTLLSVT